MVGSERDQGQEPCAARRTEGQLRRRQGLADAAAGVAPGETGVPAVVARIERFRCVIYLSGAAGADIAASRRECTQYAAAFGWEITDVIEEHVGLLPPHGRAGLGQALDRIKAAEAGAVLTAWRSMISPVAQEYDEVAREIERAGGFLHVRDSARSAEGTGR